MNDKPNYKFKPGHIYTARYTFPSRFNTAGDVINSSIMTTELRGDNIVKYGLKSCIRKHAKRLKVPLGYSCVVE